MGPMAKSAILNIFLAKMILALVYHLRFAGRLVDDPHSLFQKSYVLPVFKIVCLIGSTKLRCTEGFFEDFKA